MRIFILNHLLLSLLFITHNAFSLELDEKLTLRILKTSDSKKTVLINRGSEDGLNMAEHAKFYVAEGVVSRGVVIKISPTRSVWAMYRMISPEQIKDDQVMKLKMTAPVKITNDESRALVEDNVNVQLVKDPRELGIPLAEGADDLMDGEAKSQASVQDFGQGIVEKDLSGDNIELLITAALSLTNEESTPDNGDDKEKETITQYAIQVVGEYYFQQQESWYSQLSPFLLVGLNQRGIMAFQGARVDETSNYFGLGVNLNFSRTLFKGDTFIPYLNYTFRLGTLTSRQVTGTESSISIDQELNASVLSNAVGLGLKYLTPRGITLRAEFSFLIHGETFGEDEQNISWTRTRIGPQIWTGFGWRF